jgi:MerR family transcriptional regulator/heat shock protein HspR
MTIRTGRTASGAWDREALFVISVAARLVALHPTTLRKYERAGLLEPVRTTGKVRLYSWEDIARLRQIKYLVDERGINLAGVELALDLTHRLRDLRRRLRRAGAGAAELDALVGEALGLLGAPVDPGS